MVWPHAPFTSIMFMQVSICYSDRLSNRRFQDEAYWVVVFPGATGSVTGMNRTQRSGAEAAWGSLQLIHARIVPRRCRLTRQERDHQGQQYTDRQIEVKQFLAHQPTLCL